MIRVNDEYVIDVDSMCYTTKIDKHKTDKKGNPVYEVVGYFKDQINLLFLLVHNYHLIIL